MEKKSGANVNKDIDNIEFKYLTMHMENKRLELSRKAGYIIAKSEFYEMVAKEVGLTFNGVTQIKKGYALPSLIKAIKLSKYLGVTLDELFPMKERKK